MNDGTDLSNEACPGEALDEERSVLTGETSEPLTSYPQYYSYKKVAEIFERSPRTVRHWIQHGLLKAIRIGKSGYVPASELARLQREGEV